MDFEQVGSVSPCAFLGADFANSMGRVAVVEDFVIVLESQSAVPFVVGWQSGCVCRDFVNEKASVSAFWEEARQIDLFEGGLDGIVRRGVRICAMLHCVLMKLTASRSLEKMMEPLACGRDRFSQGCERERETMRCHGSLIAPADFCSGRGDAAVHTLAWREGGL